ncbi:MAG: ATP-binding protein [Elainella sp. Prado103]|jgi:signal transduction histidine kinase|nr:ATP-binding protein [Elainella sp. Prado103]
MTQTRILIVEDEPVIALDVEESLLELGYEVTAVADCAELALSSVQETRPDLVLMDIHLRHESNGIETATQLRQNYGLPVVFLTAHADEATLKQAKQAHPFGYVVKPFEMRDLNVAIEMGLSRYQAEMTIQKALEKEREIHDLQSRFISIVSHEFRNPLSSILFSLDLLQYPTQPLTEEKQQVYFRRARTAVERMLQLLEDVLLVGESHSKQFEFHPQPLAIVEFCQEVIEQSVLSTTATQQICLTPAGFSEATQTVCVDERLLRHILSNLLINAIKYSPSHSQIRFNVTYTEESLIFQIQDEGIGISPSDQLRLFEFFYRGANVGGIPGSGLGLSIVKQCVEAHRGQITITSQPHQGSTFTVTIGNPFASAS